MRAISTSCYFAVLLMGLSLHAQAGFVVNTDNDADDPNDNVCSLREAIIAVNAQATYHECILAGDMDPHYVEVFIAPNAGETHTITLMSSLPTLTQRLSLDATQQAGTACTPVPNLRIGVVNGNNLSGDGLVLGVGSDYSQIGGIAVGGFNLGAGINLQSDSNVVSCVIVGMDPTGMTARPNYYGVSVAGDHNALGEAATDSWLPNIFSGNSFANVNIDQAANTGIVASYIGVDASGTTPTVGGYGVYAYKAIATRIGFGAGNGPAARQRNVIGIRSDTYVPVDVQISGGSNNTIAGNYIGVGSDGLTVLPFGTVGVGAGVVSGGSSTLIGCDGTTTWDACRNVIAAPGGTAIHVSTTGTGTAIVSNFIDVAADGLTQVFGGHAPLYTTGLTLYANALVARNLIAVGSNGGGIFLKPGDSNVTPVFLNGVSAGSGGATLDSSNNCLHGNTSGGVSAQDYGGTTLTPTTFINNWWGAANGPAPGGDGDSASSNVTATPYLTAPSPYCGFDGIFVDGFEAP